MYNFFRHENCAVFQALKIFYFRCSNVNENVHEVCGFFKVRKNLGLCSCHSEVFLLLTQNKCVRGDCTDRIFISVIK